MACQAMFKGHHASKVVWQERALSLLDQTEHPPAAALCRRRKTSG